MAGSTTYTTADLMNDEQFTTMVANYGLDANAVAHMVTLFGQGRRNFDYSLTFDQVEPDCAPHYQRTLQHQDWVDGESVVQAGETTNEQGFNRRFHQIEHDLDQLGQDVAEAFNCLATMRSSLSQLLGDIRSEINQINADIYNCCGNHAPIVDTVPHLPPWVYQTAPVINPNVYVHYPYVDPAIVYSSTNAAATQAMTYRSYVLPPAGQDDTAIIAGMSARKLDSSVFNGQAVDVWSTPAGMLLTPVPAATAAPDPATTRATQVDPRISLTGDLASWTADNQATLAPVFKAGPVTTKALIDQFGGADLGGGRTLRDALAGLPPEQVIASPDALTSAVIDHQAGQISAAGVAATATVATIGLNTGAADVASVPVGSLKAVPADAQAALGKAKVATIGDLQSQPAATLAKQLNTAGVKVTAADVAGWQAQAAVVTKLQTRKV